MCNIFPTVDKIKLIFHSLNIIAYLLFFLLFIFLATFFRFSIQIDKNLANMFQFTICQVAAIPLTLDYPLVCLPDN